MYLCIILILKYSVCTFFKSDKKIVTTSNVISVCSSLNFFK